ncbi:unnamed protein product [Wuchereria bancrofti]|uniref:Uncharacterized protein n=1 Tax=Wuchereria bancrofti TaxID=6293 RepID=A0A3P7DXW4_WUCBA|nr:unnamed protein product [Wuchereria bancrofti]
MKGRLPISLGSRFGRHTGYLIEKHTISTSSTKKNESEQTIKENLFGLMSVKDSSTVSKRWVALFTCLVTRAIHMQVMKYMNVETFMQGFTRFISRRRRLKFVMSITPRTLLTRETKAAIHYINSPVARRMVEVVKRTLQEAAKKNLMGEEFTVIITEIKCLVNERH